MKRDLVYLLVRFVIGIVFVIALLRLMGELR